MRKLTIYFIPLAPGESPGDPELGGWRPLPLRFFTQWERTRLSLTTNPSPTSSATVEEPALSLEEAVCVVAVRLARFRLRQAIAIVAQRLAN